MAQGAEYEEHWAFLPPSPPDRPDREQPGAGQQPHRFLRRRNSPRRGFPSSRDEDPRQLIRRASLDLTGLLPDPADVEAFAKDPSDAAYAAYLEKHFATPAYAEHRPATGSTTRAMPTPTACISTTGASIWPYRDYVIRSFAANKPFEPVRPRATRR